MVNNYLLHLLDSIVGIVLYDYTSLRDKSSLLSGNDSLHYYLCYQVVMDKSERMYSHFTRGLLKPSVVFLTLIFYTIIWTSNYFTVDKLVVLTFT